MSITTEEQRRQLEAEGWTPRSVDKSEFVNTDMTRIGLYEHKGNQGAWLMTDMTSVDVADVVKFAAILGLPIPGYKIIREEGER